MWLLRACPQSGSRESQGPQPWVLSLSQISLKTALQISSEMCLLDNSESSQGDNVSDLSQLLKKCVVIWTKFVFLYLPNMYL